ncbi:energy transducer TonB [Flavobacterium proteolyticum]|uniref:Energy transducer TonB n=1 Tax=Flavobacterium proteolyticum TaxID=2911683 RepID=A0ABR9WRH1_9FLAO|nr:energy transducer TonB [Flavobacterium proteolyticum]MBE9576089.1 energy transducer TonB [Flavobacterium proteolyticum]
MKKITLFFFLLFQLSTFSQAEPKEPIKMPLAKEDGKEASELSFAIIEEVPLFPGCEDVERNKRLNCFQAKMNEHIQNNFKYPREARIRNIQGKVVVMFIINKEGIIENIVAKGPENCGNCEILEKEAIRIMSKLPQMTPGKQKGKAVKVKYSQPLTFKLQ